MGADCLEPVSNDINDRDARVKALYYTMRSLEVIYWMADVSVLAVLQADSPAYAAKGGY